MAVYKRFTKQEYYDELVARAKDGRFPAMDKDNVCKYRMKNGKACAVGILIPDELYTKEMEGTVPTCNPNLFNSCKLAPKSIKKSDLADIQFIHDNTFTNYGKTKKAIKLFIEKLNELSYFKKVNKLNYENDTKS